MSRIYTEEYFENKQEQTKIHLAIVTAIPPNVFYHNVIIVLAELLAQMTHAAYKEAIFHISHLDDPAPAATPPQPTKE